MRTRVDRLRVWLVGAALVLLLVVGGFLGYAHYRSRQFLAGLPGRLGANITRETDGYTYSQTMEGRTVFTLHAAKLEQRRDGLVKLHDVGVVVYGRQQNRADRIYGKEFEFDQAAGIVRALGAVNLDLQAPAPGEGRKQQALSAVGGALASTDARVIHVTTSGLVYLTKLGIAATGEDVEFAEGSMTGHSHGAEFSSDTGLVVLQSAVRVNALTPSGPMVLTANRAELDRNNQIANLTGAQLLTTAETVDAPMAVVHVRKDGSPERIEGSRGVAITRAEGGRLTAERADATLDAASKPTGIRFDGAVRFVEEDATSHADGQAGAADIRFTAAGQPEHVTLTGGVTLAERRNATTTKPGSRRTLAGSKVDVALGPAAGHPRRTDLRDAHVSGGARLVLVNEAQPTRKLGATTADLAGDEMTAHFADGQHIANLQATGHTVLHQVDGRGAEERSTGDRTEMIFRAAAGAASPGLAQIESAVQIGHVEMVRTPAQGKPGPAVQQHGTAERALFDGSANRVTLTGSVVLGDALSTVWGASVTVERATGDATAEGGVRVTYLQPAANGREAEPMHVLADHAMLHRGPPATDAADHAFFYGVAGRPARLWQGVSQVEAPVLEFDQGARKLMANGPGRGPQVHAVLVSPPQNPAPAGKPPRIKPGGGTVRIASHEMVYSDTARNVLFTGGVLVEDAEGTMRADRATAFLHRKAAAPEAENLPMRASTFFGGDVERIVAAGQVELDQPGRHGTGEQLVYTAADGMFVFTGTPGSPPRLADEARGTVTGASLRFHRGDDSVVVTGGGIEQGAQMARKPVRTETRVKQQ